MRATFVLTLLLFLALLSCGGNGPGPAPKNTVVLIFSDVTSSLLVSESEQVASLTADVIDKLAPGTKYYVYPIQIQGLRLKSITEGEVITEGNALANQALQRNRRQKLVKEMAELYKMIRDVKVPATGHGKPDNHSCILSTLDFADQILREFDPEKSDLELIFISDMIEECNSTPMGQPISLATTNIAEATKLAKDTELKFQLSHARISIIVPVTNETYAVDARPNLKELRIFWEHVFSHCGFTPESLRDNSKFYFSAGLPTRFQH